MYQNLAPAQQQVTERQLQRLELHPEFSLLLPQNHQKCPLSTLGLLLFFRKGGPNWLGFTDPLPGVIF